MARPPKVTIVILLLCVIVYFSGANDLFTYDRANAAWFWRYILASFAHYDLYHLVTNMFVFAILGSVLEMTQSSRTLIIVTLVTIVSTLSYLHFFLASYRTFAGISCVNYSILGYLFLAELNRNWGRLLALSLSLVFYETVVILGGSGSTWESGRPVWQLHLLAFVLGVALVLAGNSIRRSKEPSN
jgi:membrane associated rhomboid family serine protease